MGERGRAQIRHAALAALLAALTLAAPAGAQEPRAVRSANVTWVANLPERDVVSLALHGSSMFVSTLRGLAVYDVSDPAAPVRRAFLPLAVSQNEDVSTNGEIVLVSGDSAAGFARLYVIDVRDPSRPYVLSTLDTNDFGIRDPFAGIGHTASCVQGCRYAYLAGAARLDVVDLTDPAHPRFADPRVLGVREVACADPRRRSGCFGTHDVQVDASGVAWVTGTGGTAGYDISDPLAPRLVASTGSRARSTAFSRRRRGRRRDTPNDFIHHNALRLSDTVVAITEEDFRSADCRGVGTFQTWEIGAGGAMRPLGEWRVERDPARRTLCSAHYFDARDGLVVQSWYAGGTRFLDVSDPRRIRQVGWFVPDRTESWAAYFAPGDPAGQVVYVADARRGVDVLRVDRAAAPGASRPARQAEGSGAAGLPNLALGVDDGFASVRRGARVGVSVVVVNPGRRPVRDVTVTVELSDALELVRGGQPEAGGRRTVFRLGSVRAGRRPRVLDLVVRVRRDTTARGFEIAAVVDAPSDVVGYDDFAIDRTRIGRRRPGVAVRAARPGAGALLCRVR